jgi:hypothetical protein
MRPELQCAGVTLPAVDRIKPSGKLKPPEGSPGGWSRTGWLDRVLVRIWDEGSP